MNYSFQIRKTSFIAQKQDDLDTLNLEILDTTVLPTHSLNRYNCIDSNNLIYVSGSYIVYYNFFQNSKIFASRVSSNQIVGMAINVYGNGEYALVTQSKDKSEMTIQIYSYSQVFVPTHILHYPLEFIDFAFSCDNVIVLVGKNQNNEYWVYAVGSKGVEKERLEYKVKKIVRSERKIHMIADKGIFQFDFEKMNLNLSQQGLTMRFPEYKIDDYVQVQAQTIVFLHDNTLECHWEDTDNFYHICLEDSFKEPIQTQSFVKVGRNILVTHKNTFMLTHLIIEQDSIKFVNNYVYGDKIKAGILSVQDSLDEMHIALGVEIIERDEKRIQNFMFNLSVFSNSKKYINPFIRLIPNGIQTGSFTSFETTLSSHAYTLIGQRITTLQYKNSLQNTTVYNLYETPKFMTVHPLGYQFLCGYDNIIKFYNKTGVDLEQIWCQHYICVAAKYSSSGILALACYEDSYISLVLYDCYNFQKMQTIPITYLKMNVNKLQWVHKNQSLILYSQTEILKVNIAKGEKISDFKERKEVNNISCIDYDHEKDVVVACTADKLIEASKIDERDISFSCFKTVQIDKEINCLKICSYLKVILMGTKTGQLLWLEYPLKLNAVEGGKFVINQEMGCMKMHNWPIQTIGITNNYKFLIVSIRNSGYFTLRMRKQYNFKNKNPNIIFQELGNLNLNKIEISCQEIQQANKQKLKILLEKRKACFNDFEQFKKQWELKKLANSKNVELTDKGYELSFINDTLNKIDEIQEEKEGIEKDIKKLQVCIEEMKANKEEQYEKEVKKVFDDVRKENKSLQERKQSYDYEYRNLVNQSEENLNELNINLAQNMKKFYQRYERMKQNLELYEKRIIFEEQLQKEERQIEKERIIKKLQKEERSLTNKSNDLSIQITHTKKQNQRYMNRKVFLQHKIRFFKEEMVNSKKEGQALDKLKNKFEEQLNELQHHTKKKENKLKIYLKMNDALMKFKNIHENIVNQGTKQVDFINQQRKKQERNIVSIQKELNDVAQLNENLNLAQAEKESSITLKEEKKKEESLVFSNLKYWLQQISNALESVRPDTEDSKRIQELKSIHYHYYVEKNVESYLRDGKQQGHDSIWKYSKGSEKEKVNQQKIKQELRNQKQYILNNFEILNKCNERIKEEINLNYLQIQTQNYNLIAECNMRKEQSIQKRKELHELIDEVKETQIYMDEMRRNKDDNQDKKKKNQRKSEKPIPFVIYENLKSSIFEDQKMKKMDSDFHHRTESSNFVVRKMLDVNRIISPTSKAEKQKQFRRIQTAVHKKHQRTVKDSEEENRIHKPLTATLKNRVRHPLRSAMGNKMKSQSKPTTCTTYTKKIGSIIP